MNTAGKEIAFITWKLLSQIEYAIKYYKIFSPPVLNKMDPGP